MRNPKPWNILTIVLAKHNLIQNLYVLHWSLEITSCSCCLIIQKKLHLAHFNYYWQVLLERHAKWRDSKWTMSKLSRLGLSPGVRECERCGPFIDNHDHTQNSYVRWLYIFMDILWDERGAILSKPSVNKRQDQIGSISSAIYIYIFHFLLYIFYFCSIDTYSILSPAILIYW